MQEYVDALPSGSYVVLSHFFDPEVTEDSALARKMEESGPTARASALAPVSRCIVGAVGRKPSS